jgi:hypothetical protein
MLYLDAPIGPILGLTVFRDHADPDLFFYMNDRPRLARNDGVPEFLFLKYRRDVSDNLSLSAEDKERLGGGFLAFTVDLSVDEETLKEVRSRLAAFAGGTVKLTPVQFRKGTVRLSITKDVAEADGAPAGTPQGVSFFEHVYGSTKPSLIGDNRATFGVVLDNEGATIMEAALRSGISPIGVIYDLEYLGLRPAFNVKIRADYRRIYSHLELQFGVKAGVGPISAAIDIGLAWQKLKDEGAVKVEVTNFTDDADLRRQADTAFEWFKTELLRDFFKSALEPPSFMRQGQGGLLGSLQSLLGPLTQVQQGSPVPVLGTPSNAAPTVAAIPTSPDAGVVSLADRNRAQAAGVAPAGVGGVPGSAGAQAAGGFGIQVGFSLKRYEQEELKVREFEYSMQAAVAREAAPQGLFSTMVPGLNLSKAIKVVDLADDFFKLINAKFTLAANLTEEKIAAVSVNLEYPAIRPDGVQPDQVGGITYTPQDLTPKHFKTFLDEHLDLRYRYKVAVHFGSDSVWEGDESSYETDWIVTTAKDVTVDPYVAVDRFVLDVSPARDLTAANVVQVDVELVYEDPGTGFRAARTLTFGPGDTSKLWKLRFGETGQKTYRYRITYFLLDNFRVQGDWVTSEPVTAESGSLVVHSPFGRPRSLRVVPLLGTDAIIDANLDVIYREDDSGYEHRQAITLARGDSVASRTIVVPTLSETPGSLTVTTTVVRADGSTFQGQPITVPPEQAVVTLSDGPGHTHLVLVRLPPADLAAAGLIAVRVRLTGPGDNPDRDEALFRAGGPTEKEVAIVSASPDQSYRYEVEGYTTGGLPVPGATGTSTADELIIALPGG